MEMLRWSLLVTRSMSTKFHSHLCTFPSKSHRIPWWSQRITITAAYQVCDQWNWIRLTMMIRKIKIDNCHNESDLHWNKDVIWSCSRQIGWGLYFVALKLVPKTTIGIITIMIWILQIWAVAGKVHCYPALEWTVWYVNNMRSIREAQVCQCRAWRTDGNDTLQGQITSWFSLGPRPCTATWQSADNNFNNK